MAHDGIQDRNAAETSYLDWACENMTPNDLKMQPSMIILINKPPATENLLVQYYKFDIMLVYMNLT